MFQGSVVFDSDTTAVEVFLSTSGLGHEGSRLAVVNGMEEHSLGVDDVVVSEVRSIVTNRSTRRGFTNCVIDEDVFNLSHTK